MKDQKLIQVFVGSPGDVSGERQCAFDVIERINNDILLPQSWRFEGVGWDKTHYLKAAWRSPQEAINQGIPQPSDCDIAVFMFWKRVGTQLAPNSFIENGAGSEPTGSVWELYNAIESPKIPRPLVLMYRCIRDPVYVKATDVSFDEFAQQGRGVESLFARFRDKAGRWVMDCKEYKSDEDFALALENDLKKFVKEQTTPETKTHHIDEHKALPTELVPAAYLQRLKENVAHVEMLGLDLKESITNGLPQVYVPAATTKTTEQNKSQEGTFERDLILHRLGESSLYLPGDPGSGKSTFIQWVAYLVAHGAVPPHEVPPPEELIECLPDSLIGRLPVLIRLRDFWGNMDCASDQGDWVQRELEVAISSWLDKKLPFSLNSATFERNLAEGNLLLLLDGIDEVPEKHVNGSKTAYPRHCLLTGLADALPQWLQQDNRILISSRPYGLRATERDHLRLPEVSLLPLDDDMQRLFMSRWYAAADRAHWESYADGLAEVLKHREELQELRRNPLLLTALCVKYKEGKRLPHDIYHLYDSVVNQVLFNRFRRSDRERTEVRRCLEVVALGMHYGIDDDSVRGSPLASVGLSELDNIIGNEAKQDPSTEAGSAKVGKRREELLKSSGLLLRRGADRAEFYHQDFRDYLAAERWASEKRPLRDALQRYGANRDWRRMLGFLFAKDIESSGGIDGPLVALAGLKAKTSRDALKTEAAAALLMADCLEIASGKAGDCGLGEGWAQALRQVCDYGVDAVPAAVDRNNLFLALGRLGWDNRPGIGLDEQGMPDIRWLPVPDHETPAFYIAQYPVTQSQFQAFIDAEDGHADPRWWVGFEERKREPSKPTWPEPNAPRTDVDWFEAIAFCRWLMQLDVAPMDNWEILLPTDEQWRQAYVGELDQNFPWEGEPDPNRHANIKDSLLSRSSAVGLFPAGVASSDALDMAGNVLEWCLQKYDDETHKVGTAALDSSDDHRVLRGGCWSYFPGELHAANRFKGLSVDRNRFLGFRLVCRPPSFTDR